MYNIYKSIKYFSIFLLIIPIKVFSFENEKINFGIFSLNKYEVTIMEFNNYTIKNQVITEAEKMVVVTNGVLVGLSVIIGILKHLMEKNLIVN